MRRAIIIRGKLADSQHIELAEPVDEMQGDVEVTLRAVVDEDEGVGKDIFEHIASLPPGNRTKEDIDRQIADERASWGDR